MGANSAEGRIETYLFKKRDELGLSAWTGYRVNLKPCDSCMFAFLVCSKTAKSKLLATANATQSEKLESAIKHVAQFTQSVKLDFEELGGGD